MTVLVTGGAGYAGAHMLLALLEAGEPAVALDDLSTGARWLAPASVPLIVGDVSDARLVARTLADRRIREVVHFAGSASIPDSLDRPLAYYGNNVCKTLALIEACVSAGVERFVFSSTAAVYGAPDLSPVREDAPIRSISPYGASMAMAERILEDAARRHGFDYIVLRYFNIAGADPLGRAGQIGKATHLIRVAAQIAAGVRKERLQIYGTDYATPDGTAIRDYVHPADLAEAHMAALRRLRAGGGSGIFNCGYGRGYSVREVIAAVEEAIGTPLPVEPAARRPGDPEQLIADTAAIRAELDWRPRYDELETIVSTAIAWEVKLGRAMREAAETRA